MTADGKRLVCGECGQLLPDLARFCSHCGQPVELIPGPSPAKLIPNTVVADAKPPQIKDLAVVVARDPVVETIGREDVLNCPILRSDKADAFAIGAAMISATDSKYQKWIEGDLLIKDAGLAFLTFGQGDRRTLKDAMEVGEFILHGAAHEIVGGFFSLAGTGVMVGIESAIDRNRMLKEIQNPATLAIAATEIVGAIQTSDDQLFITTQNSSGDLNQYTFRNTRNITAAMIWRMRWRFELWWYLSVLVANVIQQQNPAGLTVQTFSDGWFARPRDQIFIDQMDALFRPLGASWRDIVIEAHYHVQRFRSVPALDKEGELFWHETDRPDYRPFCFKCFKQVAENRPLVCPSCGVSLT